MYLKVPTYCNYLHSDVYSAMAIQVLAVKQWESMVLESTILTSSSMWELLPALVAIATVWDLVLLASWSLH